MTHPNPAQLEKEASELYNQTRVEGELSEKGGTGDWHSLSEKQKQEWRNRIQQRKEDAIQAQRERAERQTTNEESD